MMVSRIDRLMMFASIVHPITAIPQVYTIYDTQDATGVSLLTWVGFMIIGLVFLSYGIVHKLKPYILNQIIWFVLDFFVVAGVLIYG